MLHYKCNKIKKFLKISETFFKTIWNQHELKEYISKKLAHVF